VTLDFKRLVWYSVIAALEASRVSYDDFSAAMQEGGMLDIAIDWVFDQTLKRGVDVRSEVAALHVVSSHCHWSGRVRTCIQQALLVKQQKWQTLDAAEVQRTTLVSTPERKANTAKVSQVTLKLRKRFSSLLSDSTLGEASVSILPVVDDLPPRTLLFDVAVNDEQDNLIPAPPHIACATVPKMNVVAIVEEEEQNAKYDVWEADAADAKWNLPF
jgi:hypothetical protein